VKTLLPQDGLRVGTVSVIREHEGHIWIGGDRGLALFDGKRIRMLTADGGQTFGGTSGIVETAAGDLWTFTLQGIFHTSGGELRHTIEEPNYRMRYEIFDSLD
jgi:ligand-binding sensor domain-containing protein